MVSKSGTRVIDRIDEGSGRKIVAIGAEVSISLPVALSFAFLWRVRMRVREGDERLSGSQADGAREGGNQPAAPRSPKDRKKDKTNVVGRALRTVYDDTLREEIPDDFLDLLGKLT
ncbi:MAG TPA: NepR family anti-sigma factor [Sphingomicrobium sp.]|nr:NepR family anti-sigma factor [Sphingomicrobium sp.]